MQQKTITDNSMSHTKYFCGTNTSRMDISAYNNEHKRQPLMSTLPEIIAKVHKVILLNLRQTTHDVCEIGHNHIG